MDRHRRRFAWALTASLLVSGLADSAAGHVVVARGSLRQYLQHSEACLHVRFETGPEVHADASGDRQDFFRARVLERLSGATTVPERIEFFPHAEGLPAWVAGDRAILCVERTDTRPEFARHTGRFPWYSLQTAGEEWRTNAPGVLAAARAWQAWLASGGTDTGRFVELVARQLESGDARLAADALQELARARSVPGVLAAPASVVRLAALVRSEALPVSQRAALFHLLSGRAGFQEERHFRALAEDARTPAERSTLARSFAASRLPAVDAWLAALGSDPDPGVRRAAVRAQARRGERADRKFLRLALADADPGVARAAIGAWADLGGGEARDALSEVAAGDDADRARWAAAALRRLDASAR